MKKVKAAAVLILAVIMLSANFAVASAAEDEDMIFDVTSFGAVSGDEIDDGMAIQDAFDACNEVGGGVVYFPAGTYCVSKTVFFYSNQKIVFEEGAVLKRIENAENSGDTCGVFLCNWFDTADTSSQTSAISCENVEIYGGTFDGNGIIPEESPQAVAMINTCHADNIYIRDCSFINNYTAHCIEINSSDNVDIENCFFGSYIGTQSTAKYNEMIQIDKSVNTSLGSYFEPDVRTIRGYYSETKIDAISPDCKGSSNINIHGCVFDANGYCSAIGNHHSSAFTTVNSNIKIYDCTFSGGTGDRGYITFDEHTENIEVYGNTFSFGKCGVTANRTDANCVVHDNIFENCDNAYSGAFIAYNNVIDGDIDADGEENAVTPETEKENETESETDTDTKTQDNSFFGRIARFFEMLIEMIKSLFGL